MECYIMSLLTVKPKVENESTHHFREEFLPVNKPIYETDQLNLWYGQTHAIKDISLSIYENEVTAIIGPSGCGKSSFLKTLNRMVELVPNIHLSGGITYHGKSIFNGTYSVEELRTRVGMVFQ